MIRAVLEGIAFSHRTHLEKLFAHYFNRDIQESGSEMADRDIQKYATKKAQLDIRQNIHENAADTARHDAIIRMTGGATKSGLWCQIMADIFELPIETVAASEPGALGAAISATVACKYYRDIADAVAHMVHTAARFEPKSENFNAYRRKYKLYKEIANSLDHVWEQFNS